ncbi:MAG TPA: DNA adenine methylase, partial [Cytophagales bacterium]|nr:DNA adenine methylase [Cytophagales bacterium]
MSGNSSKLIAFNYFGGKFSWVEQLIKHFPEHEHFVDMFCGSLAVTLNKPYSNIDTANDINSEVINFFRVLRNRPEELTTLLRLTPVSREEYNYAWQCYEDVDELEKARMFYVRVRQSFYGLGIQRRNKGWHMSSVHSNTRFGETVSKWHNAIDSLHDIIDRLTHVQLE